MAVGTSAHDFSPSYTAAQAVAVANVLTSDRLALARTMSRSFEADFGGGKGATINVKVPAVLMARRRDLHSTDPIVLDAIKQGDTFPLSLTDMIYSAVRLDDADLTLDLQNFATQVLAPQTTAVAEDVERVALATIKSVAATDVLALGGYTATKPEDLFTQARKSLRKIGLPTDGMYAAVGTGVYADLLDAGAFKDASAAGSNGALVNANVGRVRGFSVVETNALADDEIVFYNGNSFHLAVRAPIVPQGVAFGAAAATNGFAMRYIRDYDSQTLADRSVVSTFAGGGIVPVYRQVETGSIATNDRVVTLEQVVPAIRVLTGA
jgi:hypothetical protein